MQFTKSEQLYQEALQHIVGGVNSPSRSYKAVGGGAPVVMERAQGAYFWDVDGNNISTIWQRTDRLLPAMPIRTSRKRFSAPQKLASFTVHRHRMKLHLRKC
jgi:hypothetical protein